jgi:hypothetical protein
VFQLHNREAFIRRFQVVVHEHCEPPIGMAPCAHIAGPLVPDAYRGVDTLIASWIDPDPPDCAAMTCLDSRTS